MWQQREKKNNNLLTALTVNNCHLDYSIKAKNCINTIYHYYCVYWEKSYITQNVKKRNKKKHLDSRLTSRNDRLKACSIDKGTFYCLSLNVRPVYPFLKSIVIHHSYIIDVRNSQSSHDVHVRIIDIHSTDLRSPHIQQELLQGWCGCQNKTNINSKSIIRLESSNRSILLCVCFGGVWDVTELHTHPHKSGCWEKASWDEDMNKTPCGCNQWDKGGSKGLFHRCPRTGLKLKNPGWHAFKKGKENTWSTKSISHTMNCLRGAALKRSHE